MKRNRAMVRAGRRVAAGQEGAAGNSRYAKKVQGGNQMYGPGCCAHSLDVRRGGRGTGIAATPYSPFE